MSQLAAIDTINGILVDESGRLDENILRNTKETSIWLDLPDTDIWPEHMGASISVATYEPTKPTTSQTWTKVRPVDASGESVSPTATTLKSAKTVQSYDIYQTAIKSDKLNVNDLMISVQCEAQLEMIYANLAQNTQDLLAGHARSEYLGLVKNHVVLDASQTEATTVSTNEATKELTNKILDRYYMRMNLSGAARRALDKIDGRPVYGLVLAEDVSEALKNELGENLRYAGRSTELLAPLGVSGVWKNFYHMVDIQAPRYTYSGGAYTEVLPYTTSASGELSSNDYLIANTAYETAPFTDTIIWHPDVMKIMFPNPKTSGQGSGVDFQARNYRGEWTWENIKSHLAGAEYNPLGQIGFFYGVFRKASKPGFTKLGYRIRHLRPGMTN